MPRSILILDCYKPNRTLLSDVVRLEGWHPVTFDRVDDFLDQRPIAGAPHPAGVLIDAWTVEGRLREVRAAVALPLAALIVLTTQASQIAPWWSLGVSLFLTKPFYVAELVAVLRRSIGTRDIHAADAPRPEREPQGHAVTAVRGRLLA